ncbi:MAG TPA: WD40 repeat domain-containing protein [Gaiellaceae bacterium]
MSATAESVSLRPYKGLAPFGDSDLDAMLFFGREREREIVTANLIASRLTVLYGASGVGKSSMLRAGVAHGLRELARTEPGHAVVVYSAWADDPVAGLAAAIAAETGVEAGDEPLTETVAAAAAAAGELYLVLDQFEEFFLYHDGDDGPETLAAQLPELLRRRGLHAHVLISVREDALAQLDAFKPRIPTLFGNVVRLDHLDRTSAGAAIVHPIERYNQLAAPDERMRIETDLVEAVLDQVAAGRVALGDAAPAEPAANGHAIEAPYLQLVMERLWDEERAGGSSMLRLETLQRLGGAQAIVRDHLERALAELEPHEEELAAEALKYLVTPSRTKIAHGTADLAGYAAVPVAALEPVLSKLTDQRVLRGLAPVDGSGRRFEIFHDVLAEPVLAWRRRFETKAALALERRASERRHRRLLLLAGGALLVAAAMTAVTIFALAQRRAARSEAHQAHARALEATALQQLPIDSQHSLSLGLQAALLSAGPTSESVLRQALIDARLRFVLPTRGTISAVAFSPDGRWIVSASSDRAARVYAASNGRLAHVLRHSGAVVAATFDPDGTSVVTADTDGNTVVWDTNSWRPVVRLRQRASVVSADFVDGGRTVVTGAVDGSVRLWDAGDGRELGLLRNPGPIHLVRVSPDGRLIAAVAEDAEAHVLARIFDTKTGHLLTVLPERGLTDVAFARDGSTLATTSRDKTTKLWHMPDGRLIRVLDDGGGAVLTAQFSPDGKLLATGSDDAGTRVWDVRSGSRLFYFLGHTNPVDAVTWSRDGRVIASASADRTVRLWGVQGLVEAGSLIAVLAGHRDGVVAVAFSPNGKSVVSGSSDSTVRVWDGRPEQYLNLLGRHPGGVSTAAYTSNGRLILSAGADGSAKVWTRRTRRLLRVFKGHAPLTDASFGGDRLVATGSVDGVVGVWSIGTGKRVHTFSDRTPILVVRFSPTGRYLVTSSDGGAVRVWDVRSGRNVTTLGQSGQAVDVSFAPDGRLLALATTSGVEEWAVPSGTRVHRFSVYGGVNRVRFSPDGTLLAAAGVDGTARLYDVARSSLLHVLRGHLLPLTDVEFSRDGRRLVTASDDTDARVWDVETGRLEHVLRGHFGTVSAASFSFDGRWIVTAGPISAGVWPTATGRLLFYLRGHTAQLTDAEFSPDGYQVLTASVDGTVRTYRCSVCGTLDSLVSLAQGRMARAQPTAAGPRG